MRCERCFNVSCAARQGSLTKHDNVPLTTRSAADHNIDIAEESILKHRSKICPQVALAQGGPPPGATFCNVSNNPTASPCSESSTCLEPVLTTFARGTVLAAVCTVVEGDAGTDSEEGGEGSEVHA
mmetsp:Transcript_26819/g.54645  ORF Transcript_26819/g.54645 Transcript_26819/m.54645 type:complete len:126 (-) Transcript_26819:169-546(-)